MKRFSKLALPYIVWAALMLVLPMLLIALYSVMEQGNSIISFSFTLDHYVKFFTDPDFLLILWRSIAIAVKTTLICLRKHRMSLSCASRSPCGSICSCGRMHGSGF